jgi:hypothetical protein
MGLLFIAQAIPYSSVKQLFLWGNEFGPQSADKFAQIVGGPNNPLLSYDFLPLLQLP